MHQVVVMRAFRIPDSPGTLVINRTVPVAQVQNLAVGSAIGLSELAPLVAFTV